MAASAEPLPGGFRFRQLPVQGDAGLIATAINNQGQIVGYVRDAKGRRRGAIRQPEGSLAFIEIAGAVETLLTGINDFGQMTGIFVTEEGRPGGFRREPDGAIFRLGDTAGRVEAWGINHHGVVAGAVDLLGALFAPTTALEELFEAPYAGPPALRGIRTAATGINDAGLVAGIQAIGRLGGPEQNCFYRDEDFRYQMFPCGATTQAVRINNAGHLLAGAASGAAFLRDRAGNLTFVTHPEAERVEVLGLNDRDEIVGYYLDNQAARSFVGEPCQTEISATLREHGAAEESATLEVFAPSDCYWTAHVVTADAPVVIEGSRSGLAYLGKGTETIRYRVLANTQTSLERQALWSVAGKFFRVRQAGAPCAYRLEPQARAIGAAGGTILFAVRAPAACSWKAVSQQCWVRVEEGEGEGDGAVRLSVEANLDRALRRATVSVATERFTVDQAGAGSQ